MQAHYPARFEREMGCTEAEWLMWLPAAVGREALQPEGGCLSLKLDQGTLRLNWRTGEPRRIAGITLPRLHVEFAFEGLDDTQRLHFMRRFDLYMQRGGG